MSELIRVEDGKIKFELQIPAEAYLKAINSAYRRTLGRYDLPGFRRGKTPRKVIENAYGRDFFWNEEFDALVQHAYSDALAEHNIIPELQPTIVFTDVSEENGVSFTAEVVTRPVVELGQYKGIEVAKAEYNVTDEDINAEIDRKRNDLKRTISIDDRPIQEGDIVNLDFAGFLGEEQFEGGTAEGYSLKIGSNSFIPGFEEQMVGMNIGETRDLNLTFPTEYHAENLAGKDVIFKVTVNSIETEELPEFNDDFVQDTSEFNTVEEYVADIRSNLEKRAERTARTNFENAAVHKVVSNAKVQIHADIINEEVNMLVEKFNEQLKSFGANLEGYLEYSGMTMEDLRKDYYRSAEENLKAQYVITAISEAEKVEPSEENYLNAVRRFNENKGVMDDEAIKKELEKNRGRYVASAVFEATIDFIVNNAVAKEGCDCGCDHDHDCDCGCDHDHDCDCGCDHDHDCDCGCDHDHDCDCDHDHNCDHDHKDNCECGCNESTND